MTITEIERDQLQAFKDHIKSSKAKFDSAQKIEFNRRHDSYHASLNLKKSFSLDLVECENALVKLGKALNLFYVVLFIFAFATSLLSLSTIVFLSTGLIILFIHLKTDTSECKNWITTAGVLEGAGLKAELLEQVACYRSAGGTGTGTGFVCWR